jgi:phage/plasmid-like protein (TIGR03299 family)
VAAFAASGLDWKVGLHKLFLPVETQEGVEVSIETEMNAIVRDTDKSILGYALGRYDAYQNAEAFDWTAPLVESGLYTYEAAGSLQGGKKAWALLKAGEHEIVPGDKLKNYLLYTWGHDGRTPVQCGPTSVRVVCANTLRMALNGGSEFRKVRHGSGMRLQLSEVQEMYRADSARFDRQADWLKRLMDRPVTWSERQAYIGTIAAGELGQDATMRQRNRVERITGFLSRMAGGMASGAKLPGFEGTAYGLFQSTTESIEHYLGGNRVKDRGDNILFGQGARQVQAATVEMEKLLATPRGQYGAMVN